MPKGGASVQAAEPKKKHLLGRCFFFGTPEGTRTPNIQNRNLTLYPLNYGRILRSIFSMRSVIRAGIFQNVKGIFHFWGIFFPTGGSCPGVSQRMEEAQRAGEQTAARQPGPE